MNIEHYWKLIDRHRRNGAIIDTNLYLLLLVGKLDIERIGKHRRVKAYVQEDFSTLTQIIERFPRFHITPNIVTEISNLIRTPDREIIPGINELFHYSVLNSIENYISSTDALNDRSSLRLGIPDSTLKILSQRGILLITDDFPLANYAESASCPVLNFNNLRFPELVRQ